MHFDERRGVEMTGLIFICPSNIIIYTTKHFAAERCEPSVEVTRRVKFLLSGHRPR